MRKLYLTLLALICLALFWQGRVYWISRLVVPTYWKIETRDFVTLADSDYSIRIDPAMADSVGVEVAEAMQQYEQLEVYFGQPLPSPLVIVMETEALNAYIGGGYSLNSAGAYQSGVVLLGFREGRESLGRTLLHELGHHYVHDLARGNYPTWFSEGVAQLLEEMFWGSVWFDGRMRNDYYKYSISELSGDFHSLPDQISAYQMALELVKSIETTGGGQATQAMLRDLGRGMTFSQVLMAHTGMDLETLYTIAFGPQQREVGVDKHG